MAKAALREAPEVIERHPLLTAGDLKITPSHERAGKILKGKGTLVRFPQLEGRIFEVPIDLIVPNPDQPRSYFDRDKMRETRASLKADGQVSAISVVPFIDNKSGRVKLFIIDGERRFRAWKDLKAKTVQKVVIEWASNEREIYERSGIHNLHRAEHNPLELARFYKQLVDFAVEEDGMKLMEAYKHAGRKVGRHPVGVANMIRILTLGKKTQELVARGIIKTGGAIDIASAKARGVNVDETRLAALILQHSEKGDLADAVKKRKGVTRARLRKILAGHVKDEGGELGEEDAATLEASARIAGVVSSVGILRKRLAEALDPSLRTAMIDTMRTRGGRSMPPDVVHEQMGDLLDRLRTFYGDVVKKAMEPTELVIPPGSPTFIQQVSRFKGQFEGNLLRYCIARVLASASDTGGKLITAQELLEQTKAELEKLQSGAGVRKVDVQTVDINDVGNNVRTLDRELSVFQLCVDTGIVRRRAPTTGKIEKVGGYRLAWKLKRKQAAA